MNVAVMRVAGLVLATFIIAGCSETPLEAYRDAVDALADTKEAVSGQKAEVKSLQQRLDRLRDNLQEAEQALEADRKAMAQARQNAAEHASDEVLFHVIQNKLLHDDRFKQAVITVGVDNGRVTLTGVVPDQSTRKAALELSAGQPGVVDVVSKLTVRGLESG